MPVVRMPVGGSVDGEGWGMRLEPVAQLGAAVMEHLDNSPVHPDRAGTDKQEEDEEGACGEATPLLGVGEKR